MMPPNMFKRPMPTIPIPTMHLNRLIRRLRTQAIRIVIAHRDLIAEATLNLRMRHGVHVQRRLADEQAQHVRLGCEVDEGELDGLVVGEGLAKWGARAGVGDGGGDAEGGGAERGSGLTDAVFVDKGLGDGEAGVGGAEEGVVWGEDGGEGYGGVVGGHVERPLDD